MNVSPKDRVVLGNQLGQGFGVGREHMVCVEDCAACGVMAREQKNLQLPYSHVFEGRVHALGAAVWCLHSMVRVQRQVNH